MIVNLPQAFVQSHNQKFRKFFKIMLSLSSKLEKKAISIDVKSIQNESVQSFSAFAVKLNEEQLRPIILSLTKWASKIKDGQEVNHQKAIVLCKLLSCVLETLKEFFVPFLPLYFETFIMPVLKSLTTQLKGSGKKRSHAQAETSVPQDVQETLLAELCRTIQLNFKYDSGAFI